jgi:hypothetical protein
MLKAIPIAISVRFPEFGIWCALHELPPVRLFIRSSVRPFVRETQLPELNIIDRTNHELILKTLISDLLVKGLEDSMSNLHHDQAASTIQSLLERLGFRIDTDSPPTAGDDNENWRSLPQAVQTVIFPSCKNRSMTAPIPDDLTFDRLIAKKTHDIAIWLWRLTINLLMMTLRDQLLPVLCQPDP